MRSRGILGIPFAIFVATLIGVLLVPASWRDRTVGLGGLFLAAGALTGALSEYRAAKERGRRERLWALEGRWHGTDGVRARIHARMLLDWLQDGPPESQLDRFESLKASEDEDARLRRAHAILTLNTLEDFGEAASVGHVNGDRVKFVYRDEFLRFRREWAFLIDARQAEGKKRRLERTASHGDRDDVAWYYLDKVARELGYVDAQA